MLSRFKKFRRNIGGNVSIVFAITAIPLLLAAGSAVDYLRYNDVRTAVQAALDGAALAAALPADKTDSERKTIAKSYFESNFTSFEAERHDIEVSISEESVTASVDLKYPTSFMYLAGIRMMNIQETSEVMRPFAGKAEVVLVLDYSGSMNRLNKYQDMSAAASAMISTIDGAIERGKLKVGLVPFSAMVHTSMDKSYMNQASAAQTWTGCTQDRRYPFNTTVDTPSADASTKWGYIDPNGENGGQYGCQAYTNKKLKIVPLTTDIAAVKTSLAVMRPLGNTNIPLGAEFGWNLLDPALPFDEALPYSDNLNRKFLVLLTDGVQTSGEWGPANARSVAQGNENLLKLCQGMRDKGITVFTIAYDVTDPAVTGLLKSCAPGRYFEPDSGGTEINQVFSQITRQIKNRIARVAK